MDVHTVADDLGRDLRAGEDSACEARLPMTERGHSIEEMRRVTRTRVNRRASLRTRGGGVSEGHTTAARNEMRNQLEGSRQLWRDRDDTNVVAGTVDFINDVATMELPRTSCT